MLQIYKRFIKLCMYCPKYFAPSCKKLPLCILNIAISIGVQPAAKFSFCHQNALNAPHSFCQIAWKCRVCSPMSGQNLPRPPLRTVGQGVNKILSHSALDAFFEKNEKEPKKKAKRTEKESNSETTAVGRDSEK